MNKATRALMTFAALSLSAAPMVASAQTMHNHTSSSAVSTVYLGQNTAATVTYYDNDPMSSSRALRTVQVTLPSGGEKTMRRALRAAAPRNAQWARVRTTSGQRFLVNLHPMRNNTNSRGNN